MKSYTRKELAELYGRTVSWSNAFPGEGKPVRISAADFSEFAKEQGYPTPVEIEAYRHHLAIVGDTEYSKDTRFAAAELALRFVREHMVPRTVVHKDKRTY